MACAMQVTTKPGAAAGAGAESVRLENATPVLPLMPHILVRVRATAGLGLVRAKRALGVRESGWRGVLAC